MQKPAGVTLILEAMTYFKPRWANDRMDHGLSGAVIKTLRLENMEMENEGSAARMWPDGWVGLHRRVYTSEGQSSNTGLTFRMSSSKTAAWIVARSMVCLQATLIGQTCDMTMQDVQASPSESTMFLARCTTVAQPGNLCDQHSGRLYAASKMIASLLRGL